VLFFLAIKRPVAQPQFGIPPRFTSFLTSVPTLTQWFPHWHRNLQ
jgi:hypothetical protein